MFASGSISTYPRKAKQQLWDRLPGTYEFSRDKHHNMIVKGQKLTQADIKNDWEDYAHGVSDITSRTPTDPAYQSELLQTSQFCFVTKKDELLEHAEARVFRLQDGEWSLWNTDRSYNVTEKITDLTLGGEIRPPYVKLRAVEPWVDGKGLNKYLGLEFCMSEEPYWTMHHRLEQGEGGSTVQGTMHTKIPEDQQEGWREWLTKGIKVGFVGMTRYLGV